MKGIRRSWLLLPIVLCAVALAAPSHAQTTASPSTEIQVAAKRSKHRAAPARSAYANGHVYLLRGLLNIFSLGMDDLAAKIQAKGISASVHNHSEWQAIADDITVKYKARQHGPVVLVGHSLGADAVMYMAEYLGKKGVPVALVVPFDGTGSFAASSNIGQVYNLTQRDYAHMRRGSGFRGTLNNVDVSGQGYGHIDIDKSARLHAMVLSRIQTVIRSRGGSRTAGETPSSPRSRPAAATAAEPESSPAKPAAASTSAAAPAPDAAPAAKPTVESGAAAKASAEPAAAKPQAAPAAAAEKPVPATTASTNASAKVSAERAASAPPPAVSKPATVSTETSAKRGPTGSGAAAKPALRF